MNNYIIDSKQINLSSASATTKNGSLNSSLYFSLQNILKKEQDIFYNLISVVHCEIPVSFYIINSTNNGLRLKIGSNASFPYTLRNGNYNASSFRTMLLSILGVGFTLTLNNTTGIFTLGYTSSFQILPISSTCNKLLGFVSGVTYNSDVNNQIIMPFQCNFLGITRLKIKSNILQTNNIDSYSKGRSNILTTIPVNNASFGLIIYNNISGFKTIFPNDNLDYIDIQICDDDDLLLDFNGIDINISIQIDTIRKHLHDNNSLITFLNQNEIELTED
jgi:hypothetical protein